MVTYLQREGREKQEAVVAPRCNKAAANQTCSGNKSGLIGERKEEKEEEAGDGRKGIYTRPQWPSLKVPKLRRHHYRLVRDSK